MNTHYSEKTALSIVELKQRSKQDFRATYEKAKEAISILHDKFGGNHLFGNEKDESFHSSINTIY